MSWGDADDYDRCGRCGQRYGDNADDACSYHPAELGADGVVSSSGSTRPDCCNTGSPCAWDSHTEVPHSRAAERALANRTDVQTRQGFPRVTSDARSLARRRIRRFLSGSIRFDYPDYEGELRLMDLRVLEVCDPSFLVSLMENRDFPMSRRLELASLVEDFRKSDELAAATVRAEAEYVRLEMIRLRSPPHRPMRRAPGRGF